jgi:uncharacterized protein
MAQSVSISSLVVKVIRACNLRCSYCYYINSDTESYGSVLSIAHIKSLYKAYAPYLRTHGQIGLLIWHGGEPLMLGLRRFQELIRMQAEYFEPGYVINAVQTNGVLIDQSWIEFFKTNSISVGISVDANPTAHDRHRVTPAGRGTYNDVVRALRRLQRADLQAGVLCVLEEAKDGAEAIRLLRSLGVTSCDFLFPMTNHALQRTKPINLSALGTFLCDAFHEWVKDDDPSLQVRLFASMISGALGMPSSCLVTGGADLGALAIVEADGEICADEEFGQIDRYGWGKEYKLGLNLGDEDFSFDEVERRLTRFCSDRELTTLPSVCQSCSVKAICRGGHPGSRFDDLDGSYDHPSAHCSAMYALSKEVASYLKMKNLGPFMNQDLVTVVQGHIAVGKTGLRRERKET